MPKSQKKWKIRIAPGVKVSKRNIDGREFRAGTPAHPKWYETDDDDLAARLKKVPVHPNSPGSPKCFEVLGAEEARRVHEAEQARVEPQGPDAAARTPKRSRRRRRAVAAE